MMSGYRTNPAQLTEDAQVLCKDSRRVFQTPSAVGSATGSAFSRWKAQIDMSANLG